MKTQIKYSNAAYDYDEALSYNSVYDTTNFVL